MSADEILKDMAGKRLGGGRDGKPHPLIKFSPSF
jgi:hypothetical protein